MTIMTQDGCSHVKLKSYRPKKAEGAAGEMTQSMKSLLCKHEELTSHLHQPCEKLGVVAGDSDGRWASWGSLTNQSN